MKYKIIKVTTTVTTEGLRATHEETLTTAASLDDVLTLAQNEGAKKRSVLNDLNVMGCAIFKGYMVYEM